MLAHEEIESLQVQHQQSESLRRLEECWDGRPEVTINSCDSRSLLALTGQVVFGAVEGDCQGATRHWADFSVEDSSAEALKNMNGPDEVKRMTISLTCSTNAVSICTSDFPEDDRTTVMMRDIPHSYSSTRLECLFNCHGFWGRYDFMYLPIDFKTDASLGYAFVNLVSPCDAQQFMTHFQGFSTWGAQSPKVCHITWTDPEQGLEHHVEKYRNSPIMHASIPDEYKPRLFIGGMRAPFPEPTKRIRPPRIRRGKGPGFVKPDSSTRL